jgi:hypothetical protein
LLVLDCGVLHDVEALEESALLLTISWRRDKRDATESFSSTQRHLDEEAVSRMDDEVGPLAPPLSRLLRNAANTATRRLMRTFRNRPAASLATVAVTAHHLSTLLRR